MLHLMFPLPVLFWIQSQVATFEEQCPGALHNVELVSALGFHGDFEIKQEFTITMLSRHC